MSALAVLDRSSTFENAAASRFPQDIRRTPNALGIAQSDAHETYAWSRASDASGTFAAASIRSCDRRSSPTTNAFAVVARVCALEGFELWLGRMCDDTGDLPALHTPLAPVAASAGATDETIFFKAASVAAQSNLDPRMPKPTPEEILADATVQHLVRSLGPSLKSPAEADLHFVRLAAEALQARIVSHPALVHYRSRRCGGLAAWQENRAKELLLSNMSRQVPLPELASACRLSVSHFARAFGQSTGLSPHRWIGERRIATSKRLLADEKRPSLADVALLCGFSDQSHFTRSFSHSVGITPGAWRRLHVGAPP